MRTAPPKAMVTGLVCTARDYYYAPTLSRRNIESIGPTVSFSEGVPLATGLRLARAQMSLTSASDAVRFLPSPVKGRADIGTSTSCPFESGLSSRTATPPAVPLRGFAHACRVEAKVAPAGSSASTPKQRPLLPIATLTELSVVLKCNCAAGRVEGRTDGRYERQRQRRGECASRADVSRVPLLGLRSPTYLIIGSGGAPVHPYNWAAAVHINAVTT